MRRTPSNEPDEPTPEERRLTAAFRALRAPARTRRWDSAAGTSLPEARLRRLAAGTPGARRVGRLTPLALAGTLALAVAVAGTGLGLGLHDRLGDGRTGPAGAPPRTSTPSPPGAAPSATAESSPPAGVPPDLAGFTCAPHSGGTAGVPAQLVAVRVARQQGFDRITFEFSPPAAGSPLGDRVGIPEYQVVPQASARFTRDASGITVTLAGTKGLRIVVRDSSGVALDGTPTYTGSADLTPDLPTVREVTRLGDVERVLTWGVGLASPPCIRVTELTGPARVVIDVRA